MSEVLRNIVPFIQPSPARNPGGDCFCCAMTAIMQSLFPERGVTFDAMFEAFQAQPVYGSDALVTANTWPGISKTLDALKYKHDYPIDHRIEHVAPSFDPEKWSCSAWQFGVGDAEYALRAEAWLSAGWLLLAEIKYDGSGPLDGEGRLHSPNHIIAIDGARSYWEPYEHGRSLQHEIHVVCSVRGGYWERPQTLQRQHGIGAWHMVRRDER